MSDVPHGPDWWLASDGKWYPPESRAGPARSSPKVLPSTPLVWTLLAGSAAVIFGAFMPWAELGVFTKNGTSGDGMITLGLGIGLVAVVLANRPLSRGGTIG